jgi:hypothetical protein
MKWLADHIERVPTTRGRWDYYVVYSGKRIEVKDNRQLIHDAWLAGDKDINGVKIKNFDSEFDNILKMLGTYADQMPAAGAQWGNQLAKIELQFDDVGLDSVLAGYRKLSSLVSKTKVAKAKQALKKIEISVGKQLDYETALINNAANDIAPLKGNMFYTSIIHRLFEIADHFPSLDNKRKQFISVFYNMVPHGAIDAKKRELIDWYTQNVGMILKLIK